MTNKQLQEKIKELIEIGNFFKFDKKYFNIVQRWIEKSKENNRLSTIFEGDYAICNSDAGLEVYTEMGIYNCHKNRMMCVYRLNHMHHGYKLEWETYSFYWKNKCLI